MDLGRVEVVEAGDGLCRGWLVEGVRKEGGTSGVGSRSEVRSKTYEGQGRSSSNSWRRWRTGRNRSRRVFRLLEAVVKVTKIAVFTALFEIVKVIAEFVIVLVSVLGGRNTAFMAWKAGT